MANLLAVTLGNSSVAMATVTRAGKLGRVRREPLPRLETLFGEFVPSPDGRSAPIIVASVNPAAMERLRAVAPGKGPAVPKAAGPDFPIPVPTDVAESRRAGIGADRLLAALAAYRRASGACIVVDCGTAVTVDSVDEDGTFLGGAIFPGLDLMARVLAEGTAQLPKAQATHPGAPGPMPLIGKSTEEAIQVGLVHGTAGAVAGLIIAARMVVGPGAQVFLTGGGAPALDSPLVPQGMKVAENLVIEGLVAAYQERRKR